MGHFARFQAWEKVVLSPDRRGMNGSQSYLKSLLGIVPSYSGASLPSKLESPPYYTKVVPRLNEHSTLQVCTRWVSPR